MSERSLSLSIASLCRDGLSSSSVKTYLAGIRFSQIALGLGDPWMGDMPQLGYVMRGFKKSASHPPAKPRLPITLAILRKLKLVWEMREDKFDARTLWEAACMCFFGFLRSGEVVIPSDAAYDPAVHLSYGDVRVDSTSSPSFIEVRIKSSKTDVFRRGISIYLGITGLDLCPVAATLGYMVCCNKNPGSFFVFSDGRGLTRDRLVKELRRALVQSGLDASCYAGQSFRIGAATAAAASGISDSLINTLGRCESSAYMLYIRTPRSTLAAVSKTLTKVAPSKSGL